MLQNFQIIAFTHANLDVTMIGNLHIEDGQFESRLNAVKSHFSWSEFLFLSTCNRVEMAFVGPAMDTVDKRLELLTFMYPDLDASTRVELAEKSNYFQKDKAVDHLFRVASSIDSMVVGEREIITQVRNAYEKCASHQLTGDFIRLVVKQTIAIAKKVYTETDISKKPVSVVSLAYQRMKELNIPLDARFLVVGAGVTNTTLSRFLKKHGYSKFTVFNRTFSKAESLAAELKGRAFSLKELPQYTEGFDVLIACTGTDHHLVTPELYKTLLMNETDKKLVIDIAIPQDLDPTIINEHNVHHISVSSLQKISDQNLKERSSEIVKVEQMIDEALNDFQNIHRERNVELAMREVPQTVKQIRSTAMNEVFRNELETLDDNSKELLEKIIGYMEKKYMSVPMKMAKEILLKNQ